MARRYILIAEDDEDTRRLLIEALGGTYEVVGVASGADALALIDRLQDIAFAIFDNNLPGLNGIEVLREMARRQCCIPAVLMSGLMNAALEEQARSCGVTYVFRKPFPVDELRVLIDRHLAMLQQTQAEIWEEHVARAGRKALPGGITRERRCP